MVVVCECECGFLQLPPASNNTTAAARHAEEGQIQKTARPSQHAAAAAADSWHNDHTGDGRRPHLQLQAADCWRLGRPRHHSPAIFSGSWNWVDRAETRASETQSETESQRPDTNTKAQKARMPHDTRTKKPTKAEAHSQQSTRDAWWTKKARAMTASGSDSTGSTCSGDATRPAPCSCSCSACGSGSCCGSCSCSGCARARGACRPPCRGPDPGRHSCGGARGCGCARGPGSGCGCGCARGTAAAAARPSRGAPRPPASGSPRPAPACAPEASPPPSPRLWRLAPRKTTTCAGGERISECESQRSAAQAWRCGER